jgi:HlyD family secretion protein
MRLDTTDLELSLKSSQANLASAQANFDSTQSTLQSALKTAQASLKSAQANYDSAKISYDQNPSQLAVAQATLEKARVTLEQAQLAYNVVAWRPDIGMTSQAADLEAATTAYTEALATYKATAAGINDTALRIAQATLDNAKVSLAQAEKNMDTSTRTAQATLDSAKLAVEQAQRSLDQASLYAPFDGVVSEVNFGVGDTGGTSTAVSVVDLSSLQVTLTIAEVDMAQLKPGESAQMTMDAVPGKTYQAKVLSIGPVGTVSSGVVNYPVTVSITNADAQVKPGMTANLAIEVNRRENVLLLPTRAVRTQENQKTVTVVRDGQSVQTPVTTGLSNDQSVEITSGLQEGDVVAVNQTQTRSSNAPGLGLLRGFGF